MAREPKSNAKAKWVPHEDSILVRHPDLAAEADHERAAAMGLDFAHIAPGTKVPLPWQHPVANDGTHRWLQAGTSRVHMRAGCSVCRGYRADHTTSLATLAPELAKQWHPTRNRDRTPATVTPGSRRMASWLCTQCTYDWYARVSSRALDGNGCPRCAGQEALPGDATTLAVAQPQLYAELDVDGVRALGLDPLRIHVRSNRRLPWICKVNFAHRWVASPAARMNGCQCSHCPPTGQSSHPERALLALLSRRHADAVGNSPAADVRWLDRRGRSLPARCDIIVPSLRLVVEYDGLRYHGARDRRRCDHDKTHALLTAGWRVVRVREATARQQLADLDITDGNLLQVQHRYGDDLAPLVDTILAWVEACDS
jgi:hypothetical protein